MVLNAETNECGTVDGVCGRASNLVKELSDEPANHRFFDSLSDGHAFLCQEIVNINATGFSSAHAQNAAGFDQGFVSPKVE